MRLDLERRRKITRLQDRMATIAAMATLPNPTAPVSGRPLNLLLASRDVLRLDIAAKAWSSEPGFIVCGRTAVADQFGELYRSAEADVVVVGVSMWWDLLAQEHTLALLASGQRTTPVVVSGNSLDKEMHRVLVSGAEGYVGTSDNFSTVVQVVRCVALGFRVFPGSSFVPTDLLWRRFEQQVEGLLTRRQVAVAKLVAIGRSDKEIARDLQISVRTVQGLIYRALGHLNLQSRTQLSAVVWSGTELARVEPPSARILAGGQGSLL